MIVKNEAHHLSRCLDSVRSFANELIVVDTGSTDETVAIAESFGATVIRTDWTGDFSAARNESLKHATQEWILILDADELLNESVIPKLNEAMNQPNVLVVNLMRHEVGATQSPYSLVSRLFRNHPSIRFSRPYHALIDDSVLELLHNEPQWHITEVAEVAILHDGYAPDAIAGRNKFEMARKAMEAYLAEHPNDPYECSKLGALYVQMGEIDQGIALLKQGLAALDANSPQHPSIKYELHYHLGVAYGRRNQPELAISHYRVAAQQPLLHRLKLGSVNNLASLLKAQGQLQEAATLYKTCVEIDPEFAVGHYNLGTTLRALGNTQEAIAHYETALQLNPYHAEAHQNLGVALLKLGRVQESLASFGRAIALHSHTNPQEAERIRQELSQMGFQV
ncbi:tetratricopeptide repeat protein [Leptolyngbya sp. AN02str]|uniref:glycosyltransferase family 2 protein n=1 Tax=Leptolyngbya sp. AN02str TaxID=3423363 RepID=UPI003D314D01